MTTFDDKRYTLENYHHLDDLVQHVAYDVAMKAKVISRNVSKFYQNAVKERNTIRHVVFGDAFGYVNELHI